MDRLNQADLEKSLLRRDAAMSEGGELVEARVNLFFPQTAVFLQLCVTLRHTRNLIICYTLHRVIFVTLTRDLLYSSAVKLL